jgi:uncharacterized protein (TIGR02246 family)
VIRTLVAVLLVGHLAVLRPVVAAAGTDEDVRSLYLRFAAAQNARDLAAVRRLLADSPDFLWVSDGQSFWGVEATLRRMASFQSAAVWRVDPDLGAARVVGAGRDAAYLHLPLTLTIGPADSSSEFRFLVSVLCVRAAGGWRIAALFTTTARAP